MIAGELGCRILLQNFVIQHFCFRITPYPIFQRYMFFSLPLYCSEVKRCLTFYFDKIF